MMKKKILLKCILMLIITVLIMQSFPVFILANSTYNQKTISAQKIRNNGINTQIYVEKSKIKKQFKYANNLEIPYVIVLGEDEINNGTVSLKNMQTGEQTEIKIDELCENPSKYLID